MNPRDKAKQGLELLKEAIMEILHESPNGMQNVDIASKLDIRSDYLGKQQDYLSWSVLGLLLNEKRVKREGREYFISAK